LNDDEHRQAVAQAEAELAVAEAKRGEAASSLEIAARAFKRVSTLRERGVASESDLDRSQAEHLSKQAAVQVAEAEVMRARAALAAARIRLGYTTVKAGWPKGDEIRTVAARYVDEGDTVSANTALLSIIELDPLNAVLYVTEEDYAAIQPGQRVTLTTDAYPDEEFPAEVARIAPSFEENSRQARVELSVANRDRRLKPGMFIKADVVMGRVDNAIIVPEEALTRRGERTGVFVVGKAGTGVTWRTVETGIREGGRVAIAGDGLDGRVVTLGQHMVDDGSAVTIAAESRSASTAGEAAKTP
jgi:RND family efflux transporter MFP subunit